ncbi:hypothetical protein MBAV_003420, partial [Candidatus Magnetobacterium bavaricum]
MNGFTGKDYTVNKLYQDKSDLQNSCHSRASGNPLYKQGSINMYNNITPKKRK